MAPGFFRKLFTKIKDGAKKLWDGMKKVVPKVIDTAKKLAPVVTPIIDKFIPGSGAAIQGITTGLDAIQPIFKNNTIIGGHGTGAIPLSREQRERIVSHFK